MKLAWCVGDYCVSDYTCTHNSSALKSPIPRDSFDGQHSRLSAVDKRYKRTATVGSDAEDSSCVRCTTKVRTAFVTSNGLSGIVIKLKPEHDEVFSNIKRLNLHPERHKQC